MKTNLPITEKPAIAVSGGYATVFSFTHKVCPVCKLEKSVDEFPYYFSKARNKMRIGNYCKPCGRKEAKPRATKNYYENSEKRKQYAKDYRANPENKEKRRKLETHFKKKYREELKPCYVRDALVQRHGFENKDLHENPEIVQVFTNQLKIKRTLKKIKDGKK